MRLNNSRYESPIEKHVREMLNEIHFKCGYRAALINELSTYIRSKLQEESTRPALKPVTQEEIESLSSQLRNNRFHEVVPGYAPEDPED